MRPLLICALLFIGLAATAQSAPETISAKFFDLYKNQGSDSAINYLFSTNRYSPDSADKISDLRNRLQTAIQNNGTYWGYDLLSKRTAGENFQLFTFLIRHDRAPLIFRITFYRPFSKWQVQNFQFDSNTTAELQDAAPKKSAGN